MNVAHIDAVAQEIRRIDGNNSLGAGSLAEALVPFVYRLLAYRAPRSDQENGWPASWSPEDACEAFIAAEVDSAPEALRRLGEYLNQTMGEDEARIASKMVVGAMMETSAAIRASISAHASRTSSQVSAQRDQGEPFCWANVTTMGQHGNDVLVTYSTGFLKPDSPGNWIALFDHAGTVPDASQPGAAYGLVLPTVVATVSEDRGGWRSLDWEGSAMAFYRDPKHPPGTQLCTIADAIAYGNARVAGMASRLAARDRTIREMDRVTDLLGARSCINPLEDLRLAAAHIKQRVDAAESRIAELLAAPPSAASECNTGMTVVLPDQWEPCTPEFLSGGGNCSWPRVWDSASKNHWHPKRTLVAAMMAALPDDSGAADTASEPSATL